MPKIFSQVPCGNIISFAFFVLLFCAAVTSGISIVEGPCAALIERFKMSRVKACCGLSGLISVIAIPATLSFGMLDYIKIFGKTIFDFLDFFTSNIMLPLNTLFLCLISGWYMKIRGNSIIKNSVLVLFFDLGLRFVVPIALIFLIVMGLK